MMMKLAKAADVWFM